jgi:transposase-like protein
MVKCLYNDIENWNCEWEGEVSDLIPHMTRTHEVLTYSTSFHNKILLELFLDLESSGYRYVIIEFIKENQEIIAIFEEIFDESSKLFKLGLKSTNSIGTPYKITLQAKTSSISYTGQMTGVESQELKLYQNCLQVHQVQMEKFSYSEGSQAMYKVLVSIE